MLAALDRKLLRDVGRMKGQTIAVSLVMACGLMMMITTRSLILTLEGTRDAYYQSHRMADVFGYVKRAPLAMADRLAELPGVAAVEPRIVVDVTLDLPGVDEPATGHMVSLPEEKPQMLHLLFLRTGRLPQIGERREVVVSEAFAEANHLQPGQSIAAVINGHRENLNIVGIALSPEFVFEARAGETLPDNKRFGVIWMNYHALGIAYNLDGAFNDFCIDLAPGADAATVIEQADQLLARYGATGAFTRKDHASASRLNDELRVLHALSVAYPVIFLSVAAFMVNAVLARLIRLQREQIAQLKALGYSSWQVGFHYLKFALVIVVIGSVIGGVAGRFMGEWFVNLYTLFFRFPVLIFRMDWSALGLALLVSAGAATVGVIGVVRQAVNLPPAEAMRPEPPADFKPLWLERVGLTKFFSPQFRMALRNIERRPWSAVFTIAGLALATGLMVLPGSMSDSLDYLLTYQWNMAQRQDVVVFLTEAGSPKAFHDLEHLPGVVTAEPIRSVQARIRYGPHARKLAITGVPPRGELNRLLDSKGQQIVPPDEGVVMSAKLAEVLGARLGDEVQIEVLEGQRAVRTAPITGLIEDYAGVAAYMDLRALRRLLREDATVNGAYLTIDATRWADFMREIKDTPRASIVLIKKEQLAAFRKTTGQMVNTLRSFYFVLAVIVAFGVVYNSARIALSERNRDLATLRVVGFSQREVAAVLLGELTILVVSALPFGLLFGRGLVNFILSAVSTEAVRMPVRIAPSTYSIALVVVLGAACASFWVVSRMLRKLDLVGVLKARD